MHNWEAVAQNFEQNWSGNMTNTVIKSEPQSDMAFNNNTIVRNGESNPTSPHSIGSEESLHPNMYYNDTIQSLINSGNLHRPLGFNPLTPPGCPNICLPRTMTDSSDPILPTTPTRRFSKSENAFNPVTLTPSHTPPIDQTPPKSPKFPTDVSEKDCPSDIENSSMSGDDTKSLYSDYNQEISVPKVNSHGKVKTHKCKHCEYVGVTKKEFWEHSRQHIKPERQIQCKKCPFVTEYKHHFEYHLRNHEGSKPFKCPDCNYTCVNKSMLNSHLKSHSDIYQYRCENCSYATKYVHSLKLHLRKYQHDPAVPLDMDGCPDATPIIDVYGTRRGPKKRSSKAAAKRAAKQAAKLQQLRQAKEPKKAPAPTLQTPNPIPKPTPPPPPPPSHQPAQPLQSILSSLLPNMFPYSNMPNFNMPNFNFNMQMLAAQQQVLAQLSPNNFRNGRDEMEHLSCNDDDDMMSGNDNMAVKSELDISHPESPTSSVPNNIGSQSQLNNGQLGKLSDDEHQIHHIEYQQSAKLNTSSSRMSDIEKSNHELIQDNTGSGSKMYDCKFCHISFKDAVLHTIHMGYHGYNDVFTCNSCGEKCTDPISFNLHMIKIAHS